MKTVLILLLVAVFVITLSVMGIGCKEPGVVTETVTEPVTETVEAEVAKEERANALSDEVVIPEFFIKNLPNIDEEKVVPKKQYFIVFSNGSMQDPWRRAFVEDVERWGTTYMEKYGIKFMWTNAGNSSTKQLSDIETLLSLKPDLLLMSPNESGPLEVVYNWCQELGIPFICLDREINTQPDADPGDQYLQWTTPDSFLGGLAIGIYMVRDFTEKYGEPAGNVVELSGQLGITVTDQRSAGVRYVLNRYPNIRIIESRPADYNRENGYALMQDYLEKYAVGEIDGAWGGDDATMLGALAAIQEAGRDEINVYGDDGYIEALEKVLTGEFRMTTEYSPYLGIPAMAYAVSYLNGNEIPPKVVVPRKIYSIETKEKKEKLEEFINYTIEAGVKFIPGELEGYDLFTLEELDELYPVNFMEDPSILESVGDPYSTEEPWTK